jgi:hypothetical protein
LSVVDPAKQDALVIWNHARQSHSGSAVNVLEIRAVEPPCLVEAATRRHDVVVKIVGIRPVGRPLSQPAGVFVDISAADYFRVLDRAADDVLHCGADNPALAT